MKKFIILILIVIASGFFIYSKFKIRNSKLIPAACTQEAKICPDGSAVIRIGPNCDFAICPESKPKPKQALKGYLIGQVTLGPTCPVERIPPDPGCAPKPYSPLLDISSVGFFIEVHADVNGKFSLPLHIGKYTIMTRQTSLYPRCESKEAVITAGAITTINISCDTGIR